MFKQFMPQVSLVLIMISSLSGCIDKLEGSGIAAQTEIPIENVNDVVVSAVGKINITFGESESVTISGDNNILEMLVSEQIDSRFQSMPEIEDITLIPVVPLVYDIQLISLTSLSISGDMDAEVIDIQTENFSLTLNGLTNVVIDGVVNKMDLYQGGQSQLNASDLVVENLVIELTGDVEADVVATESISGNISGVSELTYTGEPVVDVTVSQYSSLLMSEAE